MKPSQLRPAPIPPPEPLAEPVEKPTKVDVKLWRQRLFNEKTFMFIGILTSLLALSFSLWSMHKSSVSLKRIESVHTTMADIICEKKTATPPPAPKETPGDRLKKRVEQKKIQPTKKPESEQGQIIDKTLNELKRKTDEHKLIQEAQKREVAELISRTRQDNLELQTMANDPKLHAGIRSISDMKADNLLSLIECEDQDRDEVNGLPLDNMITSMESKIKERLSSLPNSSKEKVEEYFRPVKHTDQPASEFVVPPSNNLHRDIPINEKDILYSLSQMTEPQPEVDVEDLEKDLELILGRR